MNDLKKTLEIVEFFIKNLDVPSEIKTFLFDITKNIENKEELEFFIKIIEDFYVKQKMIENEPEFIEKEKEIDQETEVKINQLLNN